MNMVKRILLIAITGFIVGNSDVFAAARRRPAVAARPPVAAAEHGGTKRRATGEDINAVARKERRTEVVLADAGDDAKWQDGFVWPKAHANKAHAKVPAKRAPAKKVAMLRPQDTVETKRAARAADSESKDESKEVGPARTDNPIAILTAPTAPTDAAPAGAPAVLSPQATIIATEKQINALLEKRRQINLQLMRLRADLITQKKRYETHTDDELDQLAAQFKQNIIISEMLVNGAGKLFASLRGAITNLLNEPA